MINQKLIEEPVFSAWIADTVDGGEGGEIAYGGVNKDHSSWKVWHEYEIDSPRMLM